MPAKRIVLTAVGPGNRLIYVLRADVPKGAEVRRGNYHSSYGDPRDPDLKAIRAGEVIETTGEIEALPESGETNPGAWARIEGELEVRWEAFQAEHSKKLLRSKTVGRFWDGKEWSK